MGMDLMGMVDSRILLLLAATAMLLLAVTGTPGLALAADDVTFYVA